MVQPPNYRLTITASNPSVGAGARRGAAGSGGEAKIHGTLSNDRVCPARKKPQLMPPNATPIALIKFWYNAPGFVEHSRPKTFSGISRPIIR